MNSNTKEDLKTGALLAASTALGPAGFLLAQGPIRSWGRERKAKLALKNTPDPRYNATPQLLSYYDRALQESLAPKGLSSEAIGAYNQQIAGQTTGNIRNAQRLGGGNISSQINAALNNANVIGATTLATTDANLRNQNRQFAFNRLGSATNQLQGLAGQNTGLDVMKQQAFGQAIRDARMEKEAGINNAANQVFSLGALGATGGFGGSGGFMNTPAPAGGTSFFKSRTPSFNMFNNPGQNFSQYPQIGTTTQTETQVFGEQQNPNMLEVPQFNLPVQAPFRRSRINTGFN